jgi:hypothetical protein
MGVQKHHNKSQSFNKKMDKNPNPVFSICLSRFWAFFGAKSSKTPTPQKISKTQIRPWSVFGFVWPLTRPRPPTTDHGVGRGALKFFLTDLDVCLINFRGTNQPQNIFFLLFLGALRFFFF